MRFHPCCCGFRAISATRQEVFRQAAVLHCIDLRKCFLLNRKLQASPKNSALIIAFSPPSVGKSTISAFSHSLACLLISICDDHARQHRLHAVRECEIRVPFGVDHAVVLAALAGTGSTRRVRQRLRLADGFARSRAPIRQKLQRAARMLRDERGKLVVKEPSAPFGIVDIDSLADSKP